MTHDDFWDGKKSEKLSKESSTRANIFVEALMPRKVQIKKMRILGNTFS